MTSIKLRVSYLRHKINKKIVIPILANHRKKKLVSSNFTLISNNCWGGCCYEYFGLQKQSPTIGAYFFAEDYVKFCKSLKYYLSLNLEFIPVTCSNHYDSICLQNAESAIIGKLGDVEIVFLHYPDENLILEKWKRRVERINWDNIILKFSYQNECNDELVKQFLQISEYSKFVLVGDKITGLNDEIIFSNHCGKETVDETVNFDMYINPIDILNERLG